MLIKNNGGAKASIWHFNLEYVVNQKPTISSASRSFHSGNSDLGGSREEKLYFDTYQSPVAIALFGKGKQPKIIYGPMQDYGMLKAVSEYFEIDVKPDN